LHLQEENDLLQFPACIGLEVYEHGDHFVLLPAVLKEFGGDS
jgi:hypothetical protein